MIYSFIMIVTNMKYIFWIFEFAKFEVATYSRYEKLSKIYEKPVDNTETI